MKKPFDPKEELKKMAVNVVDEATSKFIDYVDSSDWPGKHPSRQEKWELLEHFFDSIIVDINSRRTDR